MRNKLSVIIVNYNVRYFLEQCLLSVRRAAKNTDTEIIVVDNHSADGSVEMVRVKFPEVKLIASENNLGFSKANNLAIYQSDSEYVLLLNPDTVVQEDTFTKICEFMDTHSDAGGLGVKMIDGKGKFLPESKRSLPTPAVAFYKMFGLSALFPKSKIFGAYHLGNLDNDSTHKIEVLSGAFMLLRKNILDKIGLLDEDFFMYGEDVDLSYRITQAGYTNYYFPETTIIHYKGESTRKSSVNYVYVFYRAMAQFAKKHYSRKSASVFSFLINIAIWFRAFIAIFFRGVQKIIHPVSDAIVIYILLFFLKNYWETNVKLWDYPKQFLFINLPIYSLLWMGGLILSNGYKKDVGILRIVRGIFLGTILISVVYAFADESFRFSRGIILFGTLCALFSSLFTRLFRNYIAENTFSFSVNKIRNTAIAGELSECTRVLKLLNSTTSPSRFSGFIVSENESGNEYILGNISRINEIIFASNIDEIIFCPKNFSVSEIISIMSRIAKPEIEFRMVPEESSFIIGSNHRNSRGDFYGIELSLEITSKFNKRLKRIFDLAASIILIFLSPVILLYKFKPTLYFVNIFKVLSGKYSWIGYAETNENEGLPKLKPGIFSPLENKKEKQNAFKLNLLYASKYSVENDLNILSHSLFSR